MIKNVDKCIRQRRSRNAQCLSIRASTMTFKCDKPNLYEYLIQNSKIESHSINHNYYKTRFIFQELNQKAVHICQQINGLLIDKASRQSIVQIGNPLRRYILLSCPRILTHLYQPSSPVYRFHYSSVFLYHNLFKQSHLI